MKKTRTLSGIIKDFAKEYPTFDKFSKKFPLLFFKSQTKVVKNVPEIITFELIEKHIKKLLLNKDFSYLKPYWDKALTDILVLAILTEDLNPNTKGENAIRNYLKWFWLSKNSKGLFLYKFEEILNSLGINPKEFFEDYNFNREQFTPLELIKLFMADNRIKKILEKICENPT
jgi:hypothetical protein